MLLILFSLFALSSELSVSSTENNVKAMFIFGNSVVDGGNNDFLDTPVKCNYYPYSVDFLLGPTGRFSNERTPADILGEFLGLPNFLPVFYNPRTSGSSILAGVNYASSAAGILDSTFRSYNVTSFSNQISNFLETTLPDLKSHLNGSFALSSYLSQSIFLFSIGGVDYMASCSSSGTAVECDLQNLTELLIQNYIYQLKRLYDFGARKFVVLNLLQNGCAPYFRIQNNGSCLNTLNEGSAMFNTALRSALGRLRADLSGFVFSYINMSGIISEIINDAATYGLKVTNVSCCFLSKPNGGVLCAQGAEPCPDRSIYAYYDGLHPTEKLYLHLSTKAYSSELHTEAYPFNIEVLASINATCLEGHRHVFWIHDR
ncbi:unnamed protein product [Victoria cruziana]